MCATGDEKLCALFINGNFIDNLYLNLLKQCFFGLQWNFKLFTLIQIFCILISPPKRPETCQSCHPSKRNSALANEYISKKHVPHRYTTARKCTCIFSACYWHFFSINLSQTPNLFPQFPHSPTHYTLPSIHPKDHAVYQPHTSDSKSCIVDAPSHPNNLAEFPRPPFDIGQPNCADAEPNPITLQMQEAR